MEIINVKTEELISPEYNPRQATEKEYNDLKASIQKFSIVDPIIVNKRNNHIVGGNFRVRVAKDLGFTEMPCVFVDLVNDEAEKELNFRLNANHGSFNIDLLVNYDKELLKDWGFNLNDLKINIDKIDFKVKKIGEQDLKSNKCPQCGFEF